MEELPADVAAFVETHLVDRRLVHISSKEFS